MIETTELTKRYGDKLAVDHLTMSIPSGQVTGFLGPNGAGKSTTMRMILDLDSPTSGSAKVNGRRYRDIRFPLHEVGSLLEAKSVHPARTARGHLQWLADSNRIPRKRVDEVLELVGLSAVAKTRAGGFSLGMGQRLGIAAAMLGDPQTLLLDEPVNGLDPEGIVWVRSFLRSLAAEGRTVLVSSHLMSEMALTADVRVRTPEVSRLMSVLTAEGAEVSTDVDHALRIRKVSIERIGQLAADNAVVLHELSPQAASLEQAFMELTHDSGEYQTELKPPPPPSATSDGGSN